MEKILKLFTKRKIIIIYFKYLTVFLIGDKFENSNY